MGLVVSLEDQIPTAQRILDLVKDKVGSVRTQIVSYKNERGKVRLVREVANELHGAVLDADDHTMILVDQVEDPQCATKTYGLEVLRDFCAIAMPTPAVSELLLNVNFLTVVVTHYPPPTTAELDRLWGIRGVDVRSIQDGEAVKLFLQDRTKKPMLAVIGKLTREQLVPLMARKWFFSEQ